MSLPSAVCESLANCVMSPSTLPSDSEATIAARARLEAVATVEALGSQPSSDVPAAAASLQDGCRLAYSSVLIAGSRKEAQTLLSHVFTIALSRNPPKQIGGCLFYDEPTSAIVQVLEGPSSAVRALYDEIRADPRHTSVRTLWDHDVESRLYEGFGMQLGQDPTAVLNDDDGHAGIGGGDGLLQLTYISQMNASSVEAAHKHIEDILAVCVVNNPSLKIGGALFFNPRTLQVLQALEGAEAAVRALYEKIEKDTRHSACKVVSSRNVSKRTYFQWGMLQGDLVDWSSLAAGHTSMSTVMKRRRARNAREDMTQDAETVAKLKIGQPATTAKAEVKGAIQVGEQGPEVVPVNVQ